MALVALGTRAGVSERQASELAAQEIARRQLLYIDLDRDGNIGAALRRYLKSGRITRNEYRVAC